MGKKPKLTRFSVKLPYIEGEWEPDEAEQRAAWEMYVELVTRVSLQPLAPGIGLVREALSSMYTLFEETRRILREHGPGVAKPAKKMTLSFGAIAVDVLNVWLRPFLSKWHPALLEHESGRAAGVSATAHERAWKHDGESRAELERLRGQMVMYANLLAEVCEVPSLHAVPEPP